MSAYWSLYFYLQRVSFLPWEGQRRHSHGSTSTSQVHDSIDQQSVWFLMLSAVCTVNVHSDIWLICFGLQIVKYTHHVAAL